MGQFIVFILIVVAHLMVSFTKVFWSLDSVFFFFTYINILSIMMNSVDKCYLLNRVK